MRYVDGFVLVVPKKKMSQYVKIAKIACKVWQDHGALEYLECVGDDLNVQCGITFPQLLGLKSGETAIFSYIVYKSRAHRDRVNAKVMKDPRMNMIDPKELPFDMKRITFGGFKSVVEFLGGRKK